jgi:hypothetical protein
LPIVICESGSDAGQFMLNASEKSILQAVFVVGFERDAEIRTKQFEIEKALAPLLSAQSVNTNLPDEFEPSLPRVTFQQKGLSVQFTQLVAQMAITVDNADGKSINVIRDSIAKRIILFKNCIDKIVPRGKQREHGLVLNVSYPIDSGKFTDEDIASYIQNQFLRVPQLGKVANATFNVGYRTDDGLFVTLAVAGYKKLDGEMKLGPRTQSFDVASLPVVESGVSLSIDINSRPMMDAGTQPENITDVILAKSFEFLDQKVASFMGEPK